jgi:hypothetical protein
MTRQAAGGLTDFVRGGGYLVCEARPAWNDERGYAAREIPGMGLARVFGVREKKVIMQEKVEFFPANQPHPLLTGIKSRDRLYGAYFAESFIIPDQNSGQVIARFGDGAPAIVENTFGSGTALIIGSFMGMASHLQPAEKNNIFFKNLVERAQINRPYSDSSDDDIPLEIRLSRGPDFNILYLLNHDTISRTVRTELPVDKNKTFLIRNIINDAVYKKESVKKLLVLDSTVKARDVMVLAIQPE